MKGAPQSLQKTLRGSFDQLPNLLVSRGVGVHAVTGRVYYIERFILGWWGTWGIVKGIQTRGDTWAGWGNSLVGI